MQDPELPELLADMDKAALDELARRTLDELADLDQRIAGSLVNPESIYALLEQKAAKELLLSRIGLGTAAGASPGSRRTCSARGRVLMPSRGGW